MTTENNDDDLNQLAMERDRLLGEVARLRVSKETSVPVVMLAVAMTEDQARALADQALAWRTETAPAPPRSSPTSAVNPYRNGQISRPVLSQLDPADVTALWRQGKLESLGAPAPPPRTDGTHHG